MSFDIHEWMILEQVDDSEQLSIFLRSKKWNVFSLGKDYLEFVAKNPMNNIFIHKYIFFNPKGENSHGWAE